MDPVCRSISHARLRVAREDPHLSIICLNNGSRNRKTEAKSRPYTDKSVSSLLDTLIAHPDVIKSFLVGGNYLTDESGIKIAKFISLSKTILSVNISSNKMSETTWFAITAALHVNTSLKYLKMKKNLVKSDRFVDSLLFGLMHLSPHNHARIHIDFYPNECHSECRYFKFARTAKKYTPPTMLDMMLTLHAFADPISPCRH
jgi:hypothetical protein